jgi:signal transduction histidine kinase
MTTVTVDRLCAIQALSDVPAEQLQWLLDNSEERSFEPGELIFQAGDPLTATYIMLEGRARFYRMQQNEMCELMLVEPDHITGYLPFSRGKIASLNSQALDHVKLLVFPIQKITDLICEHFELTQAFVHVMISRVRDFTTLMQQNEKLVSLGKLSAGLAHELNNPATAVVRGAVSLKQHLALEPETFKKIMAVNMRPEHVDVVKDKMFALIQQTDRPSLTLMQRSEKEEELLDWLDEHHIENAPEVAENFVEFGFSIEQLEDFRKYIPDDSISAVFNWMNTNLVTERMVLDIEEASKRIAQLVSSIKTFTHMDQGNDHQLMDIHEGIRNTLTILAHKIRKGNVEVITHYDPDVPHIKASVGELNQVWTNLIDNALDAMDGRQNSKLEIETEKDGDRVRVCITDNGPGIPEEIITRIYDPFFTTKEIGKGTGMGLDITDRIIRQHKGHIRVNSVPGRTQFSVSLPIQAN